MSSNNEEKEIWNAKSFLNPAYEMWNEEDQNKYLLATKQCIDNLHIEGDRILEIGCGIGRLAITIAEDNSDKEIIGIDISDKMLDLADDYKGDLSNIYFQVNNGRDLEDIDNKSIDMVYSVVVFQHIPREAKIGYIKEAFRVLKNGGKLRFQFVEGDNKTLLSHHEKREDIIKWCEDAGFKVESVDEKLMHDSWVWITLRKI